MPACIHCSHPISTLTTSYGPNSFSLTPCSAPSTHSDCKQRGLFADPYVEFDLVTVVLDLLLAKPQAFRHLLFNRGWSREMEMQSGTIELPSKEADGKKKRNVRLLFTTTSQSQMRLWPKVVRRWLSFLLVESYIRWFYLCAHEGPILPSKLSEIPKSPSDARSSSSQVPVSPLASSYTESLSHSLPDLQSIVPIDRMVKSYTNTLGATALESLSMHLTVLTLSCAFVWLVRKGWVRRRATTRSRNSSSQERMKPKQQSSPQNIASPQTSKPVPSDSTSLFHPTLVPQSLLLASLPTLFLLSLVLLWQSKFPRNRQGKNTATSASDEWGRTEVTLLTVGWNHLARILQSESSILDSGVHGSVPLLSRFWRSTLRRFFPATLPRPLPFSISTHQFSVFSSQVSPKWSIHLTNYVIRTLLGGISSGIALGVVLPQTRLGALPATMILLAGWWVKEWVGQMVGLRDGLSQVIELDGKRDSICFG